MNILILSYSHHHSDPRILRQIQALSGDAIIYTAGYGPVGAQFAHEQLVRHDRFHAGYPWVLRKLISLFYLHLRDYILLRLLKTYRFYYWNIFRIRNCHAIKKMAKYDAIIANDIDTLPMALEIARASNCGVIFDAHEYSPLENSEDLIWMRYYAPAITAWCKTYIPQATFCTTVSTGLVKEYKKLTNVDFELILNAPAFQSLIPGNAAYPLRFIHHGGAMKARHPEIMINVFSKLDPLKYELHLMLTLHKEPFYDELVNMAKPFKNIHFHDPVPTQDICRVINEYDVGIFLLPPVNFNYEFALPNKFFEFVQARLMILIGPSVEMKEFVDRYGLGMVTPGFEEADVIQMINQVTPEKVNNYKHNSDIAALPLSGENAMRNINELVKKCIYVRNRRND